MNKRLAIFSIAALSLLPFAGCSKVDQVKEGKFLAYSTTTIGKAFDASFGNVEWTEKTTSKGQDFVEFKGDVDIDFFELLAAAIVDDVDDDLANPFAASNAMDGCLGSPFSQKYRSELADVLVSASIASLGMIALDGDLENKIKMGAKADFVSALVNKPSRITVQFIFTDSEDSDFELGYYGFEGEEWSNCNIQGLVNMEKFLDFVYSNHTYSVFNYKKIAKEIVDQAEDANQFPNELLKEKLSGYSKVQAVLITNAANSDPRVLKRKEAAEKAAAEQKRLEEEAQRKAEEEAQRKAEEEEALRLAEEEKRRQVAMKEILPVLKKYKAKMDRYKDECAEGCNQYPYWDVIGFSAPKSEYFEFEGGNSDLSWYVAMKSKEDVIGMECSYYMNCMNVSKCECTVSEDCKDITPDLSSVCTVEYE